MSDDGERDDGRWPFMPTPSLASPSAVPRELPKPRFQPGPPRHPADTRKPLPRHIVEQILAAGAGRRRWIDPVRLEMEARRRATKPERDKARSLRRSSAEEAVVADVERAAEGGRRRTRTAERSARTARAQAPAAVGRERALWASPVEETPNNEVKPWLLNFQPH